MAGNIIKNPPKFSMDKNYDVYKKELDAWKAITSVDANKLGRVVVSRKMMQVTLETRYLML